MAVSAAAPSMPDAGPTLKPSRESPETYHSYRSGRAPPLATVSALFEAVPSSLDSKKTTCSAAAPSTAVDGAASETPKASDLPMIRCDTTRASSPTRRNSASCARHGASPSAGEKKIETSTAAPGKRSKAVGETTNGPTWSCAAPCSGSPCSGSRGSGWFRGSTRRKRPAPPLLTIRKLEQLRPPTWQAPTSRTAGRLSTAARLRATRGTRTSPASVATTISSSYSASESGAKRNKSRSAMPGARLPLVSRAPGHLTCEIEKYFETGLE
mmetsp:Transcript_24379/g.83335  ORF Transcript_24379/g.83335 Transcript_24379/m.83335 type:complete len:269 (+) Transcript_24379:902-1708(+)